MCRCAESVSYTSRTVMPCSGGRLQIYSIISASRSPRILRIPGRSGRKVRRNGSCVMVRAPPPLSLPLRGMVTEPGRSTGRCSTALLPATPYESGSYYTEYVHILYPEKKSLSRGTGVPMSAYYRGRRAQSYDQRWRNFTQLTLEETLAIIDIEALQHHAMEHQRAPRLLDVACGTGVLLSLLHERIPSADLSGVDASRDMLMQARQRLPAISSLRLEYAIVGPGERAGLPFPPESFDLI